MTTAAGRAVTGAPPCLASSLSSPGTSGCTNSPSQKTLRAKNSGQFRSVITSSYLIATLVEVPVVKHARSSPVSRGRGRFWLRLRRRVHARAAVQARGVRAGALHRAQRACCPLLLHQLAHDRLHCLGGLENSEISNPHLSLIKSLTETSSSLFRSGSSSLKTEKKNKLSYISCGAMQK